jgi:hypothetical protein
MNIKDLRIPCEPPCTEPYARWCGSRGRATAPSYPIFWSQKNPISGWELVRHDRLAAMDGYLL